MKEGNIITRYWLKEIEWYNWRFLTTLPLFAIYINILFLLIYIAWFCELGIKLLNKITNINIWEVHVGTIK